MNTNSEFGWFAPPMWMRRYGPLKLVGGALLDRVALHYFLVSAVIGALMSGVFSLGTVVLRKTLHASELEIAILMAIGSSALLLGIFGSELVLGRDKRPFIWRVGLVSRGVFLLAFLANAPWVYISIAGIHSITNALMIPAMTGLWQTTVTSRMRNEFWGLTASIGTAISMGVTLLVGRLMDHNPASYLWLFPLAGALGVVSIYVLKSMPIRGKYKMDAPTLQISFRHVFIEPIARMRELMAEDQYYRRFEYSFFLYGVAFMIMAPVLPYYIVDVAKMSYTQASLCDGVLFQFGVIGLTRFWGRMMDRRSPMQLCAIVFVILACFPALLLVAPRMQYWGFPLVTIVFLAYLVYGIGMSGMSVAWNLAPIVFAGERDSSRYTGAHVTITGIRGSMAPIAGALIMKYFGYQPVLVASSLLFLFGATGMTLLYFSMRSKGLLGTVRNATAA